MLSARQTKRLDLSIEITVEQEHVWIQKYNLIWDRILGMNLFPESVAAEETSFYEQHINRAGLPLDNRATYTKLDWELWTATLAGKNSDFQMFVQPIAAFLSDTTPCVPHD